MKGSKKVWKDFIQWLRIKCIVTVKDFQKDCEWNWLVNMHSELFHVKENNDQHKACEKENEKIVKVPMNVKKNAMKQMNRVKG